MAQHPDCPHGPDEDRYEQIGGPATPTRTYTCSSCARRFESRTPADLCTHCTGTCRGASTLGGI